MSRRDLLLKCAALGSLSVVPGVSLANAISSWERQENKQLRPTSWDEIGPFYKRQAPRAAQLRAPGDPGMPLTVSGRVLNVRGEVLPDAKIEIWQADHLGVYDLDGYRYRATLISDAQGKYGFDTVMPGHYPSRVCQHIHYLITAQGQKPLVTQLYFATDPVFEGDPDRNYTRDPLIQGRDIVRPVMLVGDPKDVKAAVSFEPVLEGL